MSSSVSSSTSLSGQPTASSTTTLADGTITTPIATLTRPFTPPAGGCTPAWETTSVLTGAWDPDGQRTTTTAPALLSGPTAGAQFQACQPSGWADVVSQSRFVFSPAVCPGGWTAYGLTTFVPSSSPSSSSSTTTTSAAAAVLSSAYCCAEGFTLDGAGQYAPVDRGAPPLASAMCVRGPDGDARLTDELSLTTAAPTTTTTTTTGSSTGGEMSYAGTVTLHTAWNIIWAASDTSTLSPEPPRLTSGMYVPTWVPGTPLQKGQYSEATQASAATGGMAEGLYYFLTVGLPLLGVAVLCCCGYFWSRSRWRRDQERLRRPRAGAPPLRVEGGQELQTWVRYSGRRPKVKGRAGASANVMGEASASGEG